MAVEPLHYDLTIKTSFPAGYSGVVEITLNVLEPTSSIEINTSNPLVLLGGAVVSNEKRIAITESSYAEEEGLTTLKLAEEIQTGEAILVLRWEAAFEKDKMIGYYRVAVDGQEESSDDFFAVTQFQPISARKAFPCFDHPAKKATFSISLLSPAGYHSLSNMPESSREEASNGVFKATKNVTADFLEGKEGKLAESKLVRDCETKEWERVEFKPTPKMSTYLVAWAVGRFESIESSYTSPITNEVIPLRIFGLKSQQHISKGQGQLALDTLAASLPLYEKFFGIPYELGKHDLLVVDSFDAGAMENWGLTTLRKDNILWDAKSSGSTAQRQVVETVAHEAAHQFFGNLVTLTWWDELWLNESFATLVGEILVVDKLYPEWDAHSTFLKFHRSPALQLDSLQSSHPIKMSCEKESEVSQSFDVICYQKGCAVLKMLISIIGEGKFLSGTADYLKAHTYGNATAKDLWESLSKKSGIDVESLLDSWINKVGFPVVTIEDNGDELKLRQNRFLSSGDVNPEDDATLWTIPLTIASVGSSAKPQTIMLSTRELSIKRPEGTYLVNVGTVGTYRVAYPPTHLARLADEANKPGSKLSLCDRIGLVQDVVTLSEAGYLSTTAAFDLFLRLDKDREFLVYTEIADGFRKILDVWWEQPQEVLESLRSFARSLFGPLVEELGFEHGEEDDSTKKRFRTLVIAASAAAELPSTLEWIRSSFAGMLTGNMSPSAADAALTIVSEAVWHGTEREYQISHQIYSNAPTPQHKLAAIAGLCGAKDAQLLQRTAMMLTTGQVAQEDMAKFLYCLAHNPRSRRLVWEFFKQAWPGLEQQFKGSMLLGKIAAASFESLSTEADADMVEAFFADKETGDFQQPLEQGLESVRSRSMWLARETQKVQTWLEEKGFSSRGEKGEDGVAQ
ncbi:M1 family metallopeptidase [Sporobolomyces salmoneus]|uniref:M1 family metallopeptidase n=1 Tax=Sporobolomyces salmoneus TaxID=183962 RepID=UPI00317C7F53